MAYNNPSSPNEGGSGGNVWSAGSRGGRSNLAWHSPSDLFLPFFSSSQAPVEVTLVQMMMKMAFEDGKDLPTVTAMKSLHPLPSKEYDHVDLPSFFWPPCITIDGFFFFFLKWIVPWFVPKQLSKYVIGAGRGHRQHLFFFLGRGGFGFQRSNNDDDEIEVLKDAIFIQNLPKNITRDDIQDAFSTVGTIKVPKQISPVLLH